MKYSLRSLFVVVTLVCVVLGLLSARIEYLRRMAAFHKREVDKCAKWINEYARLDKPNDDFRLEQAVSQVRHLRLQQQYERAVYRPWQFVDETQFAVLPESRP